MKPAKTVLALVACLCVPWAHAAEQAPDWLTQGPYVDDPELWIEVPLESADSMPVVEVEVGGATRRFLFDTGSPSMMSRRLAQELKLEVVDTRQSRDGQDAVVQTDVVQADIGLGGTTFRKVPVFVADFPKTPQCFFDGVLGSEVLPLCAWQIDARTSSLRCSSALAKLPGIDSAKKLPLQSFGYPHAPFLDIVFNEHASSKALLDTGSQDFLTLSRTDLEGIKRSGGAPRSIEGSGSLGGSIGGQAPDGTQQMAVLESFAIGGVELGPVAAPVRPPSPSLVGASILGRYVVTLDIKNSAAYFEPHRAGPLVDTSFGFSMSFENSPEVSLVWDGSPAHRAGLRAGQRVTSVNGEAVGSSCTDIRKVRRAMAGDPTLDIAWEDGAATLTREPRATGGGQ